MELREEINACVDWIRDFVRNNSKNFGVVRGISGGIDSSVVAALCVRALGKENVHGLILPCESNGQDAEDAKLLGNLLGIEFRTVDLTPIFKEAEKAFSWECASYDAKAAFRLRTGNVKARLRMIIQYDYAAYLGNLVVGTTNRSELRTGFYTKFGDGGVDFEPIADFYKTEVWEMAKLLDIPKKLIDKAPSAGLWSGQTDEGEMGVCYSDLDKMLKGELPMAEHVANRINSTEHKRHLPPDFRRMVEIDLPPLHKGLLIFN